MQQTTGCQHLQGRRGPRRPGMVCNQPASPWAPTELFPCCDHHPSDTQPRTSVQTLAHQKHPPSGNGTQWTNSSPSMRQMEQANAPAPLRCQNEAVKENILSIQKNKNKNSFTASPGLQNVQNVLKVDQQCIKHKSHTVQCSPTMTQCRTR